MGEKKPKVCKCGHVKDLHIKHKKLKITGLCQSCPCTTFMRRERPDKGDKIMFFVGLFSSVGLLAMVAIMAFDMSPYWDKEIELVHTVGETILFLFGAMLFLVFYAIVPSSILPYLDARKRKSYPESLGEI